MRIHPKDLDKGDKFFECDGRQVVQCECMTTPKYTVVDGAKQWRWEAKALTEHKTDWIAYLWTEGMEAYNPSLYEQDPYMRN